MLPALMPSLNPNRSSTTGAPTFLDDRYELLELVASGGMASVWRARINGARGFSRTVAIKRMHPGFADDDALVSSFVEEARVVSELQHPNIVQVLDFVCDSSDRYSIVMEWIEGIEAGRWVEAYRRAGQPTPWEAAVAIAAQVAEGLAAAHTRLDAQGRPAPVFHRDVTPSNMLADVYGVARLADFGLARAMDRPSMTGPGVIKGKLAYVAPELFAGSLASAATDLYSLGLTLWELLAGRRAFEAKDEIELFMHVGRDGVPQLSTVRSGLPEEVLAIVRQATALIPEDRFASALEMGAALWQALENHDPHRDRLRESVAQARALVAAQAAADAKATL